jgi:hypothetical protein
MTKETYEEIHNTRKKLQLVVVLIVIFNFFYYPVSYLCHLCYIVQEQAGFWMDVIDDSSSLFHR